MSEALQDRQQSEISEALLRELLDREAIKETKARYCRFLDAHDWEGFRSIFVGDCTYEVAGFDQASGFMGHGFMMAPVMGRRIAEHIAKQTDDPLFDRWSLRRFKEDVSEVRNGFECGIAIANYGDI